MKNKETIITLLIVFSLPLQYPLIQFYFLENLYIGEYIFLVGLFIIDKKRFLLPFPILIAKLTCIFFELLPKPLITKDQLILLKYDNVVSGKYKTNFDLNLPSYADFNIEVEKYAFMWKERGQFSKKNF